MIHLLSFAHTLLSFVIVLSTIVFVHEFGHYIVAKWCKVKVEVFSIGFGKELLGWTDKSGTRWKISLLPLGGYVKMFGDAGAASTPAADLDKMSEAEKRISFHHKSLGQKAAIVAAGPLANFLLTIAVLSYFIMTTGLQTTEPVVGEVMPGSAAQEAGLQPGDRVLKINDKIVTTFNDIPEAVAINLGTPMTLTIQRGERVFPSMITPRSFEDKDALGNSITRPLLGFKSRKVTYQEIGLTMSVWEATKRTYSICETTLKAVGQMITGQRGAAELKGPIGIAKLSGQATEKGFDTILWFIAMLSANLGLINLFPVPLLDGGHLAFYAIEAVQGRPLAARIQEYGFKIGFTLLILLMAFTLFNDARQLF